MPPLNQDITRILKQPFGTLIPDSKVTRQGLEEQLQKSKLVVTVGDATTERLLGFGIFPNISIIDGKERRIKREYPDHYDAHEIRCMNPKGTISKDAVKAIQEALESGRRTRIIVDGEEDLLALPVFSLAPDNATVLYGQPLEGLVIVTVNQDNRKKAKDLMDRISLG